MDMSQKSWCYSQCAILVL